jgi:hypothetical protein
MFIYDSSYVYFILHVLSVVVSLIGGVPRMGPRVRSHSYRLVTIQLSI